MSEYRSYLITIVTEPDYRLINVALKTKKGENVPMEERAKLRLWKQLPLHVRNSGRIVNIEEIFEVTVNTDDKKV